VWLRIRWEQRRRRQLTEATEADKAKAERKVAQMETYKAKYREMRAAAKKSKAKSKKAAK
jgi:hypothetical protein